MSIYSIWFHNFLWKWNVSRGRVSFHLVEKLETLLQPCVLNLKNTCPMIYQQMNSSIWKPTQYETRRKWTIIYYFFLSAVNVLWQNTKQFTKRNDQWMVITRKYNCLSEIIHRLSVFPKYYLKLIFKFWFVNRSLYRRIFKYLQLYCVLFLYLVTTLTTGLTALLFSQV